MEYRDNGTRFKNYCEWENVKNEPYNYERNGLLKYIMSNKIVNTKNFVLRGLLNFFETTLTYIMKYIDKLKNFKNYNWKNR
jgi:hypothetical protein